MLSSPSLAFASLARPGPEVARSYLRSFHCSDGGEFSFLLYSSKLKDLFVVILLDKSAWRAEFLRRRRSIPPSCRRLATRGIVSTLFHLPELQKAEKIALYADFRGEAPTVRLGMSLCLDGKTLALPVTLWEERRMIFRRVTGRR